jgi:Mrp family chromosome partitioning ATPase
MHGSRAGNPLDRISDHFDLVIVDLPAVESAKGCGFPLTDLGGILLVLKAESTSDIVARKGLQQLARNGGKVLGIVFNQRRTHLPEWIDKRLGD